MNQSHIPHGFDEFLREFAEKMPNIDYVWSKQKEQSCQWLLDRIPTGTKGIDVGGTEYLCQKLEEKGCDVIYYDLFPPKSFPRSIQNDMLQVLKYFDPKSLDFITTRHTLEHSIVPLFQLWAYNRLLKDGGKLYVIVPMHNETWIKYPTHFNCLPYENWKMLFHRAGFGIVASDAGTWSTRDAGYIEFRFELRIEVRHLRLRHGSP